MSSECPIILFAFAEKLGAPVSKSATFDDGEWEFVNRLSRAITVWNDHEVSGCQACQARAFEKLTKYRHGSFRTRDSTKGRKCHDSSGSGQSSLSALHRHGTR